MPLGGALTLTPGQLRAIAWEDGSYLLSATAGSGKTRVLVERFVRSVVDRHVAPDRILAITFTDKAAHELRTRIRRRLAELGRRDAARAADATSISTIHAFCSRVLRQGALAAGLDPRFDVLDDAGAGRLRSRAFDLALPEFFDAFSDPAVDLAGSLGMRRLQEGVQVVHDVLRSRGTREPRLPVARSGRDVALARERLATTRAAAAAELGRIARPGRAVETALARLERCAELLDAGFPADLAAVAVGRGAAALTTPACEAYSGALDELVGALADAQAVVVVPLIDGLLDIYGRTFAQLKRAAGAVDFDDLELEALALLRDDDALRRAWAERFDLLMIDEFQDTNPRQAQLLGLLERDNLFMVGDVRQSIYGFRGAQPRIFEDRRETLGGAATGTLDESFRTRPRIAAAVNVAFAGRLGGAYVPLKAARDSVEDEPDVELLVTDTSGWTDAPGATTAWRRAEAETLARRVVELVASGAAQPAETVVLLRAATDMAAYERALAEGGLATLAVGGGYWRSLEVVDLVGYLRALANPLDTEALYELLGSPLVGLSPDALVLVGLAADRTGQDPWRALEHAELAQVDADRARAFRAWFDAERRAAGNLALDDLIARALESSGYRTKLLGRLGGRRRLANLEKLMRLARRFEADAGRDLRGLVDHLVARSLAAPREPDAPADVHDGGAVRLMTIHTAKGLEADVVCVADLGRSAGNEVPLVLVDGDRLGLLVPQPDGSTVPALDRTALVAERRAAEAAEEDRILYVAMTRARDRLVLSGAADLARWPELPGTSPIAWLGPALAPTLPDDPVATVDGEVPVRVEQRRPGADATAPRQARGDRFGVAPTLWPPPVAPSAVRPSPLTLSYSSLSGYASCAYRFYLERVLGMGEADDVADGEGQAGLGPRDRGTLVHGLLEGLDFGRPAEPTAASVSAAAARLGLRPGEPEVGELQAMVGAFAASPLCARLARAESVATEQPFAFELDPPVAGAGGAILIAGFVDVVAAEAGRTLVVDYKSDRLGHEDPALVTARDYEIQRLVYGLAALRSGAAEVEVAHCYLERVDEPVVVAWSASEAGALEARVRKLAAGVVAGRFPVAAEPHRRLCAGCPGRARLCSWEPHVTEREL